MFGKSQSTFEVLPGRQDLLKGDSMAPYKNVLFPTDFSEHATEALNHACALVDLFGGSLHVLHVVHDVGSRVPSFGMGLDFAELVQHFPAWQDRVEAEAGDKLANFVDAAWQKGKRVILATKRGNPSAEIVSYAKEQGIDLIVMSTHGRAGLPHVLVGSVAERVIQTAPCPVLTMRPSGHPAASA